jgi:type I restriction enzyme M protein
MLSKLKDGSGIAGFLLANGALDDEDTVEIRKQLIKNDVVEAIIVLPRNMFYSTDISVTLWILNKNKRGGMRNGRMLRNRQGEILFVDLRSWNSNVYEKKYVKLSEEQIAAAHKIYTDWQTNDYPDGYASPELYCAVTAETIEQNGWSLVPSRYIKFQDRDSDLDFNTVLESAGKTVKDLLKQQEENRQSLINAFKAIGYDAE